MRKWLQHRAPILAGTLLRRVGRGFPGVVGPLLVAVGLGMAWLPLGVIAAGAILWVVDWRIPDETVQQQDDRRRLRAVA